MSEFLTIEQILAVDDIPTETVHVPEWGGSVKVRGLSRAAYDQVGKAAEVVIPATGPGLQATTKRDEEKFSDALFLACVVTPQFTDEHLPALRQKSLAALNRVYEAIGRVLRTDVEPVKSEVKQAGA